MVFGTEGFISLKQSLIEAEREATKTKRSPNLDRTLEIARTQSEHPDVADAWRGVEIKGGREDILFPSLKLAALVMEETVQPQVVGHALVQAAVGGHIRCVRQLREILSEHSWGSMLVGLFNAFAFLKAAEAGHTDVVQELLQPMMSASTAIMGYVVATKWNDKESASYPFVGQPANPPGKEWMQKLWLTKSMLPPAGPNFQSGGWDLRGLPGLHDNLHEVIRASYRTYLLWRAAVTAASQCGTEVFKVLLKQRALDNSLLADSLSSFEAFNSTKKGSSSDGEARKIISDRAKMDTLMYQLVEEYSTKNYHDAMLFTLWGHIQRGARDSPRLEAGRPRCVAQAQNGLWDMQLEVPLMMMPVEHALPDEEPFRRYKQLTLLFSQRAKVSIQLVASVEATDKFLQVTVGVKHVRFKVENSRWDDQCMGHFPSMVTLSVTPISTEGTAVTMTNSSSNISYKIGKGENIHFGTGASDGATKGLSAGIRAGIGVNMSSTMKSTPWRFEQLPLQDDRGGSFVWTLQAMKGVAFDRSNPLRMAETNSKWRWGKRVPGNPLDELPFTSEGGVIFTDSSFADTMNWRFPKDMEGKKLRWSIEGHIHSTFTTSRYFETRKASFRGDIEEKLQPVEAKKDKHDDGKSGKKKDKDEDEEKSEKKKDKEEDEGKNEKKKDKKKDEAKSDEKKDSEKDEGKSEKREKGDKSDRKRVKDEKDEKDGEKAEKLEKSGEGDMKKMDPSLELEFLEWLEFKKYKEQMKCQTATNEAVKTHTEAEGSQAVTIKKLEGANRGAERTKVKMSLDLDDGQVSSPKPPQVRGNRQLDSGERLYIPTQSDIGATLGSKEEEDLCKVPELSKPIFVRDSSDGTHQRPNHERQVLIKAGRISGFSVRTRSREL